MEDEGVDLATERIEAEAARSVDEEREFVAARTGNYRPDENEPAKDSVWLANGFPCGGDEVIVNQNISRIGDDGARN